MAATVEDIKSAIEAIHNPDYTVRSRADEYLRELSKANSLQYVTMLLQTALAITSSEVSISSSMVIITAIYEDT